MVAIDVVYHGGLRCIATHGPSGSTMQSDAPVDNHGTGLSFSPTDLVGTALGTCILTVMGIVAQRDGIDMEGSRVHVEKTMSKDAPRRIVALDIDLTLPPGLSADERRTLERAAHGCPVEHSLHPELKVTIRIA